MGKYFLINDLQAKIQDFLDENADDIGSYYGIWQDNTDVGRNAELMAKSAMVVIESQELQNKLEQELNKLEQELNS